MRVNSLAFRLTAGAVIWCVLAFLLGGIVLASLFKGAIERALDERLEVVADNMTAVARVREDGSVVLTRPLSDSRFERVFSGWYWQIDGLNTEDLPEPDEPEGNTGPSFENDGSAATEDLFEEDPGADEIMGANEPISSDSGMWIIARSRSLWDEVLDLPPLDQDAMPDGAPISGPDGQSLRVLVRRIGLPGADRPYRLAVAADIADMRREVDAFNAALGWSMGLIGLFLVLTLLVQVRIGLAPLNTVRRGLAAVRSGQAERLTGRFPGEIEPLAHELNKVLDHNKSVVDRARTQAGNLAHALKTPLSVLSSAAERDPGPLSYTVLDQAATMRRQVDHHLARARTAASAQVLGARTAVYPALEGLLRTLRHINRDRTVKAELICPKTVIFRGEQQDLEEMAGNLLDNAFKWATARAQVIVARKDSDLVLAVSDDGPGLPEDKREEVLRRGARLDETVPGSGLGLSIVQDIARAYGGELTLERSALGGLEAIVTLPRA